VLMCCGQGCRCAVGRGVDVLWAGVSMCCGQGCRCTAARGVDVLWAKELDDGLAVFPISVDMVFRYDGVKTCLICFEGNRTA